nr:hypothetical protein [Escherichia coli]
MANDATQRIEKVVADYRNTPGRSNYDWQVKEVYKYGELIYICGNVLAGVSILMFFADTYIFTKIVCAITFILLFVAFIFKLSTFIFRQFQEKIWHNDTVSESDILYLCENMGLKSVITEDIRTYPELTYSFLVASRSRYVKEIALQDTKKYRDKLIAKLERT